MSVAALPRVDDCARCDSPEGETICEACTKEEKILEIRDWLTRARTVAPGLTHQEVAVVERLIQDLEAS